MLKRSAREVELVAALPIPDGALQFDSAPATAFLQLAYPWAKTPGSADLPGQVESPDGVLTGLLARNALIRGTFRSAANLHLADVIDVQPVLDRHEQQVNRLIERVCLLGPTPSGLRLLSDVTMSTDETYRPGSISRLISTIVRTARRVGEDVTFQPSGERLWGEVASRLDAFLRGLYQRGVFRGASVNEAYQVRCDRSTMTQSDIDNGRVIALVQFDAAAPVDTITVVLIVNDGNQSSSIQSEAA
jgi:phage tail sheath protein FI